jgi:hypothetical protein
MTESMENNPNLYGEKLLSVALNRISGLISANMELEALLIIEKEKTVELENKLEQLEKK